MYESYWQVECKPFECTGNADFYYPAESHQGALLKLRYAIENRREAALLAGDCGVGKTLVARTLMKQLEETARPALHLVFPQLPPDQLLSYLADELTGQTTNSPGSIEQSFRRVQQTLLENAVQGRHALIVIDEAHLLAETGALDWLRLLMNVQHEGCPTMTLLLVGDASLLPALERMPSFDERIGVKCLMRSFNRQETAAYIQHRLAAAGAGEAIFTTPAVETIHEISGGVPRRINRLADLALLIGFADEVDEIDAPQIEAVSEELLTVAPE